MATWLIVVLVVLALVLVVVAATAAGRSRRSARLKQRFGPEYDRRLEEHGDRRLVEAELRDVTRRRDTLDVQPLSEPARLRYLDSWQVLQAAFVDRPDHAVEEADQLVAQVMRERGYPVEDFEDRVDMVAVDHPEVVEHYRGARAIAERNSQSLADTDELRQALLHYRRLFEELLDASAPVSPTDTQNQRGGVR